MSFFCRDETAKYLKEQGCVSALSDRVRLCPVDKCMKKALTGTGTFAVPAVCVSSEG